MAVSFFYNFVKKNHITKPLFIGYFVALALFVYFLLFTVFGERGLIKLISLQSSVSKKAAQKEELLNNIKTKKAMVEGMDSKSLDLDLLDEQARKVLGYVGKDEVVVYREGDKKDDKDSDKKQGEKLEKIKKGAPNES